MKKKIATTFLIKFLIALLNLFIVIAISRFTGAQGKGEASIIVTTIAMVLLFCNLVGGSSLVYFVPRYNTLSLFIFSNLWSIIVCFISLLLFENFALIPQTFIIPIILLSLINSLLATNLTIILGKEKIMSFNLISLFQTIVNLIVLLILIKGYSEANIDSYVYSLYTSLGLCFLISTIMILPYLKKFNLNDEKKLISELVKLGLLNQASHIMKFASFRISFYVLVIYSGNSVLGIFSNGTSLVESVLIISNSFASILYPKISNSTDINYSQKITLQMTKASILLCTCALIPLIMLPSEFWIWLFGSEFQGVQKVILLLSPGLIFYNIVLIIGHYFSGIGKYSVNTFANFIGLFITIVLILLVIPKYGIFEASLISTCAYLGTSLITMIYFAKESQIKFIELFPTIKDLKWMKEQSLLLIK